MFALIHDSKVVQIEEFKFEVAGGLEWVECDSSVKVGYSYINKKFKLPEFSKEEILLKLKTNLEIENNKSCLVKVGNIEFLIKKEDEITIERRIKRLSALPSGSTAEWSDSSKERLNLTLPQFQELLRTLTNHLDIRDEQNFAIYFATKKEIEEALTIEEANAININFN